ncbi:MAG: Transcriptional regulator [Clostridia bacterium]|jgi:DNA-binding CsgD family transcriptional regulator|nr:Transcriptional regulator [Clostridia bacterium]
MDNLSELFWSAAVDEIKRGYVYQDHNEQFICLICGKTYTKGLIYNEQGTLMEAERAVRTHAESEHGGMFEYLLNMNKKYTGLTEHQQTLLRYFNLGHTDKEIVKLLGGGSTSTVRNHRFSLREREKQAKVFLAIMGLLDKDGDDSKKLLNIHRGATMIDERYAATESEREKFLKTYFDEKLEKLINFPSKEKRKLVVLQHITGKFESDKKYTEKEVSKILEDIYPDFVTIRRYLIEYGFMERTPDGSAYWVKK